MTKAMKDKMKKLMEENKKLKAMMKKKKMMGGGMTKGTKYKAAGGGKMPMVMKDGKLIEIQESDTLYETPNKKYTQKLVDSIL